MPLPEELLALIISYLAIFPDDVDGDIDARFIPRANPTARGVLVSLCLVSKQCCRLARPWLYHTIVVGLSDLEPTIEFGAVDVLWRRKSLSWRKLVRTLIYQPRLARYVKRMYLENFADGEVHGEEWDLPYEEAVLSSRAFDEEVVLSPRAFEEECSLDIVSSLRGGSVGAHAALLLALCQDLQSLAVILQCGWESTFTGHVLFKAGPGSDLLIDSASPVLSSLKALSLKHWDTEGCLGFYAYSQFEGQWSNVDNTGLSHLFTLPMLRRFRGHMMDFTAEEGRYESFSSNLTRIVLDECLIDAEGLALILQACPRLQDLAISWGGALVGECDIDFEGIGKELVRLGRCLKYVTLDWEQKDMYHEECGGLGDLSSMDSLEILRVSASALVGFSTASAITLPTSLKRLDVELTEFAQDEHFLQQLKAVLERGKLHSLAAITYSSQNSDGSTELGTFWTRAKAGTIETETTERIPPQW